MKCPQCSADNGSGRTHCYRCGGVLAAAQAVSSDADSAVPMKGVRLRVVLPICILVGVVLLICGYARWQSLRAASAQRLQAEQEAAAAQEQQRMNEALERVPLVNARANDLLRAGNLSGALQAVDELLAIVDSADLQETKVNILLKAGRHSEAYQLLVPLLEKRDLPHLHFLAGQLAQVTKGAGEAVLHFAEALRQRPQDKIYQLAWAKASLLAGMRDSAIATFNKMVDEDPKCVQCWHEYALACYVTGDRDRAVGVLQQAVNRFPADSAYRFSLGRFLDRYGLDTGNAQKLQEAAMQYRKSLELAPRRGSLAAQRYYEIMHVGVPPELENISVDEIELEPRGRSLFMTAKINGLPARFVLDTGASVTCIHKGALARFGIEPSSQTVPMQTANGLVQGPLAYADIQLGRHILPRSVIFVIPDNTAHDADGLFGLDSLRKLNAQIDSGRGRLVIQSDQTETLGGE